MPGYSSWAFLMRRCFRRRPSTNTTSSQCLLTATDAKTVWTLNKIRVFVGATTTSPQRRIISTNRSYSSTISEDWPSRSCSTATWPQEWDWLRFLKRRRHRGQHRASARAGSRQRCSAQLLQPAAALVPGRRVQTANEVARVKLSCSNNLYPQANPFNLAIDGEGHRPRCWDSRGARGNNDVSKVAAWKDDFWNLLTSAKAEFLR